MNSPQPDAPIPLVPVDNAPSHPHRPHESSLKREEGVVPTRHVEGDTDPPQYPPPPPLLTTPRTPHSSSSRGRVRHTRTGSTRAVPGFGTRSRASIRHALYLLLERPTSSHSAFVLHLVTNVVIVLSALLTILETIPLFHTVNAALWFGLETAVVVLFTVEYIARSFAWGFGEPDGGWKRWWAWATSFFALIDLFSILPYYVELALHADTTAFFRFSILRTFRLLRVFRPFRYSSTILLTIEVMILSTRRSKHALLALSFFVSMALIVFSTLLYFAERGVWDDTLETFVDPDGMRSQFESIPAAAWFVLVTITTVGYGEIIPRSFLGRLITVPLLLFGLLLVALPSFVLGREFAVVWEEMSAGVLDGLNLGLSHAPESPTTPYTGRDAAAYGILPGEDDDDDGGGGEEKEEDATAPLTGGSMSKGKGREKGKGRVLFDSGMDDEERGIGIGIGIGQSSGMRQMGISASSSLPSLANINPAANARTQKERMERRRERVDSNAEAHTSAFMRLHRRNVSSANVVGGVGGGGGGEVHAELRELLRELKNEREALRVEREALRVEREALGKEREAVRTKIGL